MRSSNRSRDKKFVMFSFFCFFIGFSLSEINQQGYSQVTSIHPPALQPKSNRELHLEPSQVRSGTSSPTIEVLSTSFMEGENVFRVKITDELPVTTAQTTFVQNGQLVTRGLVRQPNNIYEALIDAHEPAAVVVTSAVDADGKKTSLDKDLNVTPPPNYILAQLMKFFADTGKSIVSIFVYTKQ